MAIELVDTHCHIQFSDFTIGPKAAIENANAAGVTRLMCVGCRLDDSELAVTTAQEYDNVWASIGLHPHEAKEYVDDASALQTFAALAKQPRVMAVGECGLDYFYTHSPKEQQVELLKFQIELAKAHDLPLIFHVREAFDDFWPIFDSYSGLRGVIHSFSAGTAELEQILARPSLYVGINGIMTFTKKPDQLAAAKAIPLERLLLETDAPYLTPAPFRGTMNEPKYVRTIAEFLAALRAETIEEIATQTTQNAIDLFKLK